MALIEAYARVVDRLIRVEPWQALIKYGADALEGDRPEDFRSLLKFGVLVDIGGAAGSAVVAVAFVVIAGRGSAGASRPCRWPPSTAPRCCSS